MDNNIPKGCKPFDLQKAMAGEPVVTRDGRPYKFGAYNPDAATYKMVGWINNRLSSHDETGSYNMGGRPSDQDLFMAAKTQKVWVNLWRINNISIGSRTHYSLEDAQCESVKVFDDYIFLKTIETEVEL